MKLRYMDDLIKKHLLPIHAKLLMQGIISFMDMTVYLLIYFGAWLLIICRN